MSSRLLVHHAQSMIWPGTALVSRGDYMADTSEAREFGAICQAGPLSPAQLLCCLGPLGSYL